MSESSPLKRTEQLAPLSREHHDGLLFVWKIRQGLKNNISQDRLRSYCKWFWQNHIKPHFSQEENILIPFMPPGHPLVEQLKSDHAHIRELILEIDRQNDQHDYSLLCSLLDKHIRFEERELFTFLQKELTGDQLDDIYRQLEIHPISCKEEDRWKDEFWIKAHT